MSESEKAIEAMAKKYESSGSWVEFVGSSLPSFMQS